MSWYKNFSLSTWLTLLRLVGSPVILPFLFICLLPLNNLYINCCLTVIFLFFGMTDFFDGFLARRYGQVSFIGSVLDPIADKFLLYSALVALQAAGKLSVVWVVVMIGREFFVMGLRQLALEHNFSITVSSWGKIKTVIQIIALAFVIANPYQACGISAFKWNGTEFILLSVATAFSLWSARDYFYFFMKCKV